MWSYDVFLSFRGEDTRNNFTSHLYTSLCQRGLHTFIDDHDLRRGEEIAPTLVKAIQESMGSVIVFSENYASSRWCLDELLNILDCKTSKGQLVWPIFYKVDPSDVRKQRGSFAEAIQQHESRLDFNKDRVQRWRTDLTHAASLSGWQFTDGNESKFIQDIVEEISIQVSNRTYLKVAEYPVGLEPRVRDMHELLCVGENDVRMVGIWGIGGIGKTTVAKAVYGSIAHQFEGSCFLANVRERSSVPHEGMVQLQETLLSKMLGGVTVKLSNVDDPAYVIEKRLWNKRVLLILDDVDHLKQLENLAGGNNWFGPGSRIIITTRHKHLLIDHRVNLTYKVKELDSWEAFELFSWNSFRRDTPVEVLEDYVELVERAVIYTKRLPLALTLLGSYLCGKSIKEWQVALDSYEKNPNKEIQEILKLSYNGLPQLPKPPAAAPRCVAAPRYLTAAAERNKFVLFEGGVYSFDLKDLMRTSAELLGKGSVGRSYKAVLEEGTTVVVKRLKDVVVTEKEFYKQMEVLGKIKHDNVVPLRAFYNSKDEKLLVSDYMSAGSLSDLLHGSRGSGRTPLNWDNRMRIATSAARGLAHIHVAGKVVHGNIKSSNIFLRPDHDASVSDFGLNPLFGTSTPPNHVALVARYRAPEVVETRRVTFKSDVYSFGVLLLELLTGKASEAFEEGINLPRWVQSVVREEWIAEVFDLKLFFFERRYQNIVEEMAQLMQIAMSCVSTEPYRRPSMREVVRLIEFLDMIRAETDNGLRKSSDDPSKGSDGQTPPQGSRTPPSVTPTP